MWWRTSRQDKHDRIQRQDQRQRQCASSPSARIASGTPISVRIGGSPKMPLSSRVSEKSGRATSAAMMKITIVASS